MLESRSYIPKYWSARKRTFYYNYIICWKNSAWLGTSIMIDRETPLAEIVGQMLLSKNTDVSTQSWVFISVNDEDPGLGRNVCIF